MIGEIDNKQTKIKNLQTNKQKTDKLNIHIVINIHTQIHMHIPACIIKHIFTRMYMHLPSIIHHPIQSNPSIIQILHVLT